jgi:hypothetical protein
MIRKLVLALAATVAIAGTALAPTSASAWGWNHHHFHGFGLYVPAYDYVASPDCYVVQKTYVNKWGKLRVRNVTVCD